MKSITVKTQKELQEVLANEDQDALFRGQTMHFQLHGAPSFKTSFERQGCIPEEMLKWTHFAFGVLNRYFEGFDASQDFSQAVLQHYGWRSFYLDATSKPSVAAWFASNSYKSSVEVHIVEDHEERPALIKKLFAHYEPHKGNGHLYVFDKQALLATAGAKDLSALKLPKSRPRFTAQSAWMIGPFTRKPMPPECIRAHIVADANLLRELAAADGLTTTESLFPGVQEDPVLYSFLSLPWLAVPGQEPSLSAFVRAIEFPEYVSGFEKRLPGNIALYTGGRITPPDGESQDPDVGFLMMVPTDTFVGSPSVIATKFPNVLSLLREHGVVGFEVDYLSRQPGLEHTDLYSKGISVRTYPDGLIEIGEITVNHPGFDLTAGGVNAGWYYRLTEDEKWERVSHEQECPCGHDFVHERHLAALTMIDRHLGDTLSRQRAASK